MKPWEKVVDRIGKALMRTLAVGLAVGIVWAAIYDWDTNSSAEGFGYLPFALLFLAYGLGGPVLFGMMKLSKFTKHWRTKDEAQTGDRRSLARPPAPAEERGGAPRP